MKVVIVEPMCSPRIAEIEESLETYQKIVDGWIECIYPFNDSVGLVCNEEGKLNNFLPNRALFDDNGEIYDIIFGTFFVVGLGEEDFRGLTDEQAKRYMDYYREPQMFVRKGRKVIAVPVPTFDEVRK